MEATKQNGMNKDQFWNLIGRAKEVCGTDLEASAVWIKQQLFYMTSEDVLKFHNLVYSYRDAAYKYGLWTAAGIMMEAGCSDGVAAGQPPACSVPFPRRNAGMVPGVRGRMRNSKIK